MKRESALRQYGFTDVCKELFYDERTYNAQDYATLISTYSDHKAIPKEQRIPFLKEISHIIECHGGEITLSDTMSLCIGRKP